MNKIIPDSEPLNMAEGRQLVKFYNETSTKVDFTRMATMHGHTYAAAKTVWFALLAMELSIKETTEAVPN